MEFVATRTNLRFRGRALNLHFDKMVLRSITVGNNDFNRSV